METLAAYLARTGKTELKEAQPFRHVTDPSVKSPSLKQSRARSLDEVYERPWPLRVRNGRLQGLKQGGTCPDCLARADERNDGRSFHDEERNKWARFPHAPLDLLGSPRRHPQYGYSLTNGCEGCGGTGNGTGVWVDITEALKKLTLKQRFVIERRYGIGGDGRVYTQQEIADSLGVERQTIQEHESKAKKRIQALLTKTLS